MLSRMARPPNAAPIRKPRMATRRPTEPSAIPAIDSFFPMPCAFDAWRPAIPQPIAPSPNNGARNGATQFATGMQQQRTMRRETPPRPSDAYASGFDGGGGPYPGGGAP